MPDIDSCPSEDALQQLLSGDLDNPGAWGTVEHVDRCGRCQAMVEHLATGQWDKGLGIESLGDVVLPSDQRCDDVVAKLIRVIKGETFSDSANEDMESLTVPDRLEHYRIEGLLGHGGMGAVLKAWDTKLNRFVAIKQLRRILMCDEDLRQRILSEARAAAAINHPGVVPVYSVHDESDPSFFVMEYVEGGSLQHAMDQGRKFSLADSVAMAEQIAIAIDAAHQCGVVHCDIKPANVLLDEKTGTARLTDFGVSYAASIVESDRSGKYVGTPHYMSPEQCRDDAIDPRTDLFSLGVLLYRLLSASFPFEGDSVSQLKTAICQDRPKRLRQRRPEIPEWLDRLVHQLLQKNPEDRLDSAAEVVTIIRNQTQEKGIPSALMRWVPWLAGVTLVVSLIVANRWGFRKPAAPEREPLNLRRILVDSGQRLGSSPAGGVAVGDFDNDGDMDIVVSNGKFNNPQPNRIWLNDGDGVFHATEQLLGERISSGVATGDVDGDGDLDLFFANWSDRKEAWGQNRVWLNDGTGTFVESDQDLGSPSARNVQLADFDADGDLDAWVANYKEPDRIWLNDGHGNFEPMKQTFEQWGSSCVAVADIDQDGDLDAIVVGQNKNPSSVWLNNGDGSFVKGKPFGAENMWWIVLVDVDGNQTVDAVVREKTGLRVYMNSGNGEFEFGGTHWPCSGPCRLGVSDLNNDGFVDILVGNELGSPGFYVLNDGTGHFPEKSEEFHVGSVSGVAFADFDNDGDTDVYFANGHDRTPHQPDHLWLNQAQEQGE